MTDNESIDREDRTKSASGGDDERENREHIESTGESTKDEFGNADGAS